ncbi:MAG TPA: fatty acid desaturase [Ignavibacteria bacterium]|nr:fatty acid desaturase [Ignavibacteria bacterium]HMR40410.1 fatty acid desaturase [Ignavibacteria bacterium]
MLKFKADIKTLIYLCLTTAMLFIQWNFGFHPVTYIISLYLAVTVAVIAHNHNHVPMWKSKILNDITDYWITLFYGFPAFAWTPTHNKNHHKFNNKEGDYTITYRVSEKNNIFTLLSYPSISSYFQQNPIVVYLKFLWNNNRKKFFISIMQYVALGLFIIIALLIDWKKAILYVIIPQQFALFSVLIFNYIQHVHADEESDYNHSRNFVSPMTNFLLFNNGFHTIHHYRASIHWSETPEAHKKIDHLIAPHLKERGFWPYIFKAYLISPFKKTFRTRSMRLDRIAKEQGKEVTHG